jgi:hypothetical protein
MVPFRVQYALVDFNDLFGTDRQAQPAALAPVGPERDFGHNTSPPRDFFGTRKVNKADFSAGAAPIAYYNA